MPRKTHSRAHAQDPEFQKAKTAARLAAVGAFLIRGVARADLHRVIAKEHGVTAFQVKLDVSAVFRQWREQTMHGVEVDRARQMTRVEKTVFEAWQAWNVPVKQWDPLMDNGPGKKRGGFFYDRRPEPRFLEHILKATQFEANLTGTRRPFKVEINDDREIARIAREHGLSEAEVRELHKKVLHRRALAEGVIDTPEVADEDDDDERSDS